MTRITPIIEEEFYHIYNRGVDKRKIFNSSKDYERFLFLLFLCNSSENLKLSDYQGKSSKEIFSIDRGIPLVSIYAYSLMPNHFHLLVKGNADTGGIPLFMQKLSTAYTMYFNKRNSRSGALLQGTYKSSHVGDDPYMKYIFAYIHSNPFSTINENGYYDIENINEVMDYKYSSILDYRGVERNESVILDKSFFVNEYKNDKDITECLKTWLAYHPYES